MYKLKKNGYVLKLPTNEYFNDSSPLWNEYQEWLGLGNTVEPEFNDIELREKVKTEIIEEANRRVDIATGNDRQKRITLKKQIHINKKRIAGQPLSAEELTTESDIDTLNNHIDALHDKCNTLTSWVDTATIPELEGFVASESDWPEL